MVVLVLALLIGVVAGLRTFTAPAAVGWAAALRNDLPAGLIEDAVAVLAAIAIVMALR